MSATASHGQILTFFIGEEKFAAATSDIAEVFRQSRVTRVPNGPPSLLGIAGLRGAPTPVISLARLMGKEDQPTPSSRLLLLNGDQPIGLAVDRVGSLASMPIEILGAATSTRQGFGRVYLVENASLRVLDLENLLQRAFAGHNRPTRMNSVTVAPKEDVSCSEDSVVLLAFELAGQAYALPLTEVSEVLALPEQLAKIAQSDNAVLGIVNNRDRLLPIVSARQLLGLPGIHGPSDRVVMTHVGSAVVGLAVDRLQAILRVPPDAVDAAPMVLNRGPGEAQVQAICRLPDAGRLVAILSGERLFRDEKVAHILADGQTEESDMSRAPEMGHAVERFLLFRVGSEEYGLPLAAVEEVVRLPKQVTRVPNAPPFIEGVFSLRGKVTPIIDQRTRFASAPVEAAYPRVIVITVEGSHAGFIVDSASEIISLDADQISATPELSADSHRLFSRIATVDNGARLVLLIEPKEMLDRAERDLLASLDASIIAAGT